MLSLPVMLSVNNVLSNCIIHHVNFHALNFFNFDHYNDDGAELAAIK